jgi:hypothetical protein
MNTSKENIYNKEFLDTAFLTENNIKRISTYSFNDKDDEILIGQKYLNSNGTINKLIRGNNKWGAYPPTTELTHELDYIEEYKYENENLILIEEKFKSGSLVAKHKFSYKVNEVTKKSFALNKDRMFEVNQIELESFNSNGKLLEHKTEILMFDQNANVKYQYPSKDLIIKTAVGTIFNKINNEQTKIYDTKFLLKLDSLGRLRESIWELEIDGFIEKSSSFFRYRSKDSNKLSLVETFEKNIKVNESQFTYGSKKELTSYKLIDDRKEIQFRYEYKGSD